jgi:hypothetical protein
MLNTRTDVPSSQHSHFRREVTHGELFETKQTLLAAARDFFDRYNQCPEKILSVIGSHAQNIA